MTEKRPLNVVLCLHMHQPEYRDLGTDKYQLPWTYLHAIKDYTDIAAHVEAIPAAKLVVNFSPVLLVQLQHYADELRRQTNDQRAFSDPLLDAVATPDLPVDRARRQALVGACLRANRTRVVERFPIFHRLSSTAVDMNTKDRIGDLSDQFLIDLVVWYHLAWMGETVRRQDATVKRLIEKGADFDMADRLELLATIARLLTAVVPRYSSLADDARVELSMSPAGHPILPLLLDFKSAREAVPDMALPAAAGYPGGAARAREHLEHGREVFSASFNRPASGCWPSEGAVSTDTLRLLGEAGFSWAASGEGVLRNSLRRCGDELGSHNCYTAYRVDDCPVRCFFRDDALSDAIGFNYQDWHADDAVADLISRLETIRNHCENPERRVVPIILDGENAWEHYPENAYYFLSGLFERLARSRSLKMTTFSECLEQPVEEVALPSLVAGSWVYGTLSTWMGERSKNRAWDLLVEAKRHLDAKMANGTLNREQVVKIREQLEVCEGSDWFWWLGDVNPSDSVQQFDGLFRMHLRRLYELMEQPAPGYLSDSLVSLAEGDEAAGVMRRANVEPPGSA